MDRKLLMILALVLMAGLSLDAQPACSLETIVGTYAVRGDSTIFVPVAGTATLTSVADAHVSVASIDYSGNAVVKLFGTMGGEPSEMSMNGKAEVNRDCTGLLTYKADLGTRTIEGKSYFIAINQGDDVYTIPAESTMSFVGGEIMKRMSRMPLSEFTENSTCSADMLRGTYLYHYEGDIAMEAQGKAVSLHEHSLGVAWVDNTNRMVSKFATNMAGQVLEGDWVTLPETMKVNSDCTGSVSWKPVGAGMPDTEGMDRFVILDGGREFWTVTVKGMLGKPSVIGVARQISTLPPE